MKKEVVVINGTGGSGKDTFISKVSKYAKIYNFSSIDKVKKIATLVGWNGTKTEKDRKFLSDLKKLTTNYNDMAFNETKKAYELFLNSDKEIMFIHIREKEEIEKAVKEFNAKTLLIKRKGYENISSNLSDANVEDYNYDFVIINDTIEQLDVSAKKFVEDLKKQN